VKAVKKDADVCFLCEQPGKGKRFTFYSGIKKGGTTHRMASCTITFFERWSDLMMHQVHVCRDCQVRLWRRSRLLPTVALGAGMAVAGLLALVGLVLLDGAARFAALGVGGVAVLLLGALFGVQLRSYLDRKPKHSHLEALVIQEAIDRLPGERTYLTSEQYVERHEAGIIG
jgi:hypothetical protein